MSIAAIRRRCRGRANALVGSARWGLRVLRAYARIGLVRKSQFRWEFLNQVGMDAMFYVAFVLTFTILFGLGDAVSLGGWSFSEVKVFLGMAFLADAIVMTWLGQNWHFGTDLKNGALDPFRVRPGSTAFLYFFQRFSPEGLTNLLMALAWTLYALSGVVPGQVSLGHLAWAFPAALIVMAWAQVFMVLAYNLVEMWVMNSDIGHLTSMLFSSLGERPLDIYPRMMRRALTFVAPVAALAWYPASLILGRLDPWMALGYPVLLIGFAMGVARLFRRGLARYESAMG